MRKFVFFKIQLKRYLKLIPVLILGIVILSLFSFVAVTYATKMNKSRKKINKETLVFSSKDDSPLTAIIVDSLSKSESINAVFNIKKLSEKKAIKEVKTHKALAAVVIPDDFMDSLDDGDNYPITIYFSENSSIHTLIITEISQAAQTSLKAAEATIYSSYDYYEKTDLSEYEDDAQDELNTSLLSDAMSRGKMYHGVLLNSNDGIDFKIFYISSAILIISLLLGSLFIIRLKSIKPVIPVKLSKLHVGYSFLTFTDIACIFITLYLLFALIAGTDFALSKAFHKPFNINMQHSFGAAAVIIIFVSLLTYFSSKIFEDTGSSIFFVFGFTLICSFLSGGIIPSSVLPKVIVTIGKHLPTTYMLKVISSVFTKGIPFNAFMHLGIYIIILAMADFILGSKFFVTSNEKRRSK